MVIQKGCGKLSLGVFKFYSDIRLGGLWNLKKRNWNGVPPHTSLEFSHMLSLFTLLAIGLSTQQQTDFTVSKNYIIKVK
jgi:hypothetical protein